MTDTTAPNSTIRTLAETAVKIVSDHWGKALASALSAVVAAAITLWLTPAAPAPVVKTVEVVRTVPSNLEAKIDALAKDISDLKAALPSRKKK